MYKKSLLLILLTLSSFYISQLRAAILVKGETLKLNSKIVIANGIITIQKSSQSHILKNIKPADEEAINDYDIDTDDDYKHALKKAFHADEVTLISEYPNINHLNLYDLVLVSANYPKLNTVIVSDNAVHLISGVNGNTKKKASISMSKQESPATHYSSTAKIVDTSLIAVGQENTSYTIFSDGYAPSVFQNIVQAMQVRMSNKSCPKRAWIVAGGYGIIGVDSIAGTAYFISGKEPVNNTTQYISIIKKTGVNRFYANIAYNFMALDSAKLVEILNGPLGDASVYYLPPTGKVLTQIVSNSFKKFMIISYPTHYPSLESGDNKNFIANLKITDYLGNPLNNGHTEITLMTPAQRDDLFPSYPILKNPLPQRPIDLSLLQERLDESLREYKSKLNKIASAASFKAR